MLCSCHASVSTRNANVTRRSRPVLLAIVGVIAGAVGAWITSSVVIDLTGGDVALSIATGYVGWVLAALLAIGAVIRIAPRVSRRRNRAQPAEPASDARDDHGGGGAQDAPTSHGSSTP